MNSLRQATTKINVAVDRLPQFHCCKDMNPEGGPEHMGTIHIGSERYLTDVTPPSYFDNVHHVIHCCVQLFFILFFAVTEQTNSVPNTRGGSTGYAGRAMAYPVDSASPAHIVEKEKN